MTWQEVRLAIIYVLAFTCLVVAWVAIFTVLLPAPTVNDRPSESVPQAPPAPITDLRCHEGQRCWDCTTMGNGLCKDRPTTTQVVT